MQHSADEIVNIAQEVRVPVGPVPGMLELLRDPHLAAREFWDTVETDGRSLHYPGPPFKLSRHGWQPAPPPRIGADTSAVLSGLGAGSLDALRQARVTRERADG